MPDSFFASTKKRKRTPATRKQQKGPTDATQKRARKSAGKRAAGSESEEDDLDVNDLNLSASETEPEEEEEIQETAAEKRVRLAKAYLDKIQSGLEEDLGDGFDAADLDRDLIGERLKKDADEIEGRLHRRVADKFDFSAIDESKIQSRRGHQLSVTAVVVSDNGSLIYTASKDGSIIKWDAKTLTKLHTFPGGRKGVKDYKGHTENVFCLAISTDNQYLASGGRDKVIHLWSVKDNEHLAAFTNHKDAISGLAFRKGHNQLYSASWDRTIKVWNIDERGYIETLFGHQDQIASIDTLGRERCVSTGGRDKTARMWKIVEESQLVFRGGISSKEKDENGKPLTVEGSVDCIAQVDESTFITGGDSGALCLWDIGRKKPVFSNFTSHGMNVVENSSGQILQTPYGITALASLRYSDLFVSGSWDGTVRFWKISQDIKSFAEIGQIQVKGVINSIQIKTVFPSNRTLLVIGVGQEMRTGRWLRLKGVKNCTKVIELPTTLPQALN